MSSEFGRSEIKPVDHHAVNQVLNLLRETQSGSELFSVFSLSFSDRDTETETPCAVGSSRLRTESLLRSRGRTVTS